MKVKFAAVMTSEAATTMTVDNWLEVGVQQASYDLSSLLVKPGIECLKQCDSLAKYVGWEGKLILDASRLVMGKGGLYQVRSPYDGKVVYYEPDDIARLLLALKADVILCPPGIEHVSISILASCPDTISLYFATSFFERLDRNFGTYIIYVSEHESWSVMKERISACEQGPLFIRSDVKLKDLSRLIRKGVEYIATDTPASDAVNGIAYTEEGEISLQDKTMSQQFETLITTCACPTCKQDFSRAYLYHVFQHVPLLGKRLLMQHNVYQWQLRWDALYDGLY